jgi:hypothetical protein
MSFSAAAAAALVLPEPMRHRVPLALEAAVANTLRSPQLHLLDIVATTLEEAAVRLLATQEALAGSVAAALGQTSWPQAIAGALVLPGKRTQAAAAARPTTLATVTRLLLAVLGL